MKSLLTTVVAATTLISAGTTWSNEFKLTSTDIETHPRVIGWDASGVVSAIGPDVTLFKPGDAVLLCR